MRDSSIRDLLDVPVTQERPVERLTRQQAAEYLSVTTWTLDYWRRQNRGPRSYKIVGRVYYLRPDIDAWLQDQLARTARGGVR